MCVKLELSLVALEEGLSDNLYYGSYAQAKLVIKEMLGLTEKDSEEINQKIDLLEKISLEPKSKKKKWEKMKPVLAFAMNKSVDVEMIIMMLMVQM